MSIAKRDMKYLNFLAEMAQESPAYANAKVASLILFKNGLIITGTNQNRTDPWAQRFARKEEAIYIHAEVQAIKTAVNHFRGDRNALQGASIYVARVKRSSPTGPYVWGLARPCEGCSEAIELFGVKRVVYTTDVDKEFDSYKV